MAKKCFVCPFYSFSAGDRDGLPPISPAVLNCSYALLADDNTLIEINSESIEMNYDSTLAALRTQIQADIRTSHNDQSITFVWLDDKGLL